MADFKISAAIAVCLVLAAGFGLSALHYYLRVLVGSGGSSAIIAIGLLSLAFALDYRRKTRIPALPPEPVPSPVPITLTPAPQPVGSPGISSAFLAGFLLARRL